MKLSIIIPTYNHLNDNLKPCLESIVQHTNMSQTEVIVVANGCKDGTASFVSEFSKTHPTVRVIDVPEPLGYTKATNVGLGQAVGEYLLLLNDDTVILDQPNNFWIDMMIQPFVVDPTVAITGPVKFIFDCGGLRKEAMAFWCVMVSRTAFNRLGFLDEIFSPGMGEDADYSIKAQELGYKIVQVPSNTPNDFDAGIPQEKQVFPIFHKGNGTFGSMSIKDPTIDRNKLVLEERYGNPLEAMYTKHYDDSFPLIRKYASRSAHITEVGVLSGNATYASLVTKPNTLVSCNVAAGKDITSLIKKYPINFQFIDVGWKIDISHTDMLINIAEDNDYLLQDLLVYSTKARKYIVVRKGNAVEAFLQRDKNWTKAEEVNGWVALSRSNHPEVSIIVTTHNHLEDALKPCLEKLFAYTDLNNKEVIIAANGCTDGTWDYLEGLKDKVRVVWSDQALGYAGAVNQGMRAARGTYIVTIDNDSHLLPQKPDQWIQQLVEPFSSPSTGMSGPFWGEMQGLEHRVLFSGCSMFRRDILEKLNYFDEIYFPGFLSDADMFMRIKNAGHDCVQVGLCDGLSAEGCWTLNFPIYHPPSGTTDMHRSEMIEQLKRNKLIFDNRYVMKPKTNETNIPFPGMPSSHSTDVTIVIPTYNRCDELLKPCIESIKKYTNLDNKEVIVVANGCTDNTEEYVKSLGHPFRLIWEKNALGYTKATNLGIKAAKGEFVILLNNDTVLLPQPVDAWIHILKDPFNDPAVGVTSPLKLHDNYSDRDILIFFCAMIRRSVFDKIGLLNEEYSPGGGEDVDFCAHLSDIGMKCIEVPSQHGFDDVKKTPIGDFPIYHIAEGTFNHIPEYGREVIKINGLKNLRKYNKNVRLNFGCGEKSIPTYMGVDINPDFRTTDIIMNVAKRLELDDNSVKEIISCHLLEYLPFDEIHGILTDWKRVLAEGGNLIIETTDYERLTNEFVKAPEDGRQIILQRIFGNEDHRYPQRSVWYPSLIQKALERAGFTDISFKPAVHANVHGLYGDMNFRVECKKPVTVKVAEPPKTEKTVGKPEIVISDALTVTAEVSTKGRYDTTLPLALMSIANQIHVPNELIIFDDDEHRDLRSHGVYAPIFKLFEQRGIFWRYIFGDKKGQTLNHQKTIDLSTNALIWRVDDDDNVESNVLQHLLSHFSDDVGAIGSLIKIPGDINFSENVCSGKIEDIYSLPNIQWSSFNGIREVDHLNNSFLFRRSSKYAYELGLSPVGHREETIFSYRIKRAGYRVLVDGGCTTWHMKAQAGGIRSYSNHELWAHDEQVFSKHMQAWGIVPNNYKLIVLDNGLGDHFMFKSVLPEIKAKHKNIILASCYDVFEKDPNIRIISIADSVVLDGDRDKYNIYKFCVERNWKGTLEEAFKAMYL